MSKRKVFLALFLCALFFSPFALAADAEAGYPLSVSPDQDTTPSTIYPGTFVVFNVNIESEAIRYSVTDTVAKITLNPAYFSVEHSVEALGTIEPKATKTAVFRFRVNETTPPGTYKFPLKLTYERRGDLIEETTDVNISVSELYSLDIGRVSLGDSSPHIGDRIVVSVELKNNGTTEARDTELELIPVTNDEFDPFITLSETVVNIGNLSTGASRKVGFELSAQRDAAPGVYVFKLSADCIDCSSAEEEKFSFGLLGRPEMVISGIDYSNDVKAREKTLLQGDSFSLSIQLDNIGNVRAKGVVVDLELDEGVVGVKQSFLGNIDDDDSGAAIFDFVVSLLAEVGEHKGKINVTYLDETDEEKTVSTDFSVFVHTRPPESPLGILVVVLLVLVAAYFLVKMIFRQLALRKAR